MGMMLLVFRLIELQIILGKRNRELAEGNRIRRETLAAPRGIIFDRDNKPLVRNVPVYRVRRGNDQLSNPKYQTISREEALRIEVQGGEEAEKLRVDVGRDYLYGSALAHVLGYLGEVSEEEVKSGQWQVGDLIGRTGIEEAYDGILRGLEGGEIYEVDTGGNRIREIDKKDPKPGEDIYLSIDGDLQRVAYEALEGRPGAVVATEVKTGRVLILVSSPSFDPNLFVRVEEQENGRIGELLIDLAEPFFNRAIGGVYPPGSTFKIVTAVAGLEEGKIDEETKIEDPGVIKIGQYSYANWYFTKYGKTEGNIDIIRAIKRSTDTFFYKVGEWLGAERLADWAKAFGLGKETGIDIDGETTGLVPNPEWKEEVTGERWFLGNTYHFSIGQADLLTTPLQINMMTNVIANNGKLCVPKIARNTSEKENTSEVEPKREPFSSEVKHCQDLQLKQETLELVKKGLEEACSPGGTASIFFNYEPQVACKTGTAEFGLLDEFGQRKTHAWLTAFAPVDDPEIVVTALVEGGGEGSIVAAPIVKKVMETWFKIKD